MWQSHAWNGEETAFRDFTFVPERDLQP
ncbi:MAG: hypothetical protein WA700_17645 [Acidobacteriaceae bacterium]